VLSELSDEIVRFRALGGIDLRRGEGGEISSVLRQPKRLALLAYLMLATPRGFHRRDVLLAMFWPELAQQAARHALRNALYNLRRHLGESVITNRGADEVGIGEGALWCDALEFERALDRGQQAEALELYGGDLLPGFFLSIDNPAFEQWVERERGRLRLRAADAAWSLASAAEREGNAPRAVETARMALTLRPDDEPWLRKVLALLYRLGDQAGALRTYEEFAARLSREFEVEPAPETRALMRQVRERRPTAAEFVMPRRSSGAGPRESSGEGEPPSSPKVPRRIGILATALLLLAAAAFALLR
jgi:DNA-binding SARP family transcriptional activator